MQENNKLTTETAWPDRPQQFPPIMTPTEAAQFLRLDYTSHTPQSAKRTLDYWRNHGDLKGTKYARHVWYLKDQLEVFLKRKTEA
ncbi:MAG: helix-turn-helix domain-containing protein [Phycisphaerae bacterium]|nr:helix-turn-helix domain-containing protein [Phycisphaerae bacterium]